MTTTPHPPKPPTQVNTTDGGTAQFEATIAPLHDGGYVVVWTDQSRIYNTAGDAIVGQRYDSAGNKVGGDPLHGGEVMLSQFPDTGDQFSPAVTTLANGNIAVAFVDLFSGGIAGPDNDIWVRIFDPSLHEVRTDSIELSNTVQTIDPSVTALADGGYVVSYTVEHHTQNQVLVQDQVVARIVSATGAVGTEFNLSLENDNHARDFSHLATLSNGNVVAVYQDAFPGGVTSSDIRFSMFTPSGQPTGPGQSFVPGAATFAAETQPNVAALHGHSFVITWTEPASGGSDIHATILDNVTGTPIVSDLLVNTTTTGNQTQSDVVALGDGGFLVTWDDSFSVIRGQRFDAVGHKIGVEFTLDSGGLPDHRGAALLTDNRVAFALDHPSSGDADVETSLFTIGVADAHVHDVNGDGSGDLLWRNDNGATGIWELRGGQPIAAASLGSASPDWHVAATGDFNGDGKSDILWHNDNGVTGIWELNGSSVIAAAAVGTVSPDWQIATTGDFNGDGKSDILWHNDNGTTSIWELNGTSVLAAAGIGTASPDWHIADTGDFNGDGKSDILWHNDNGAVGIWELDGTSVVAAASVGSASPDWQIARTGDFNGDGHSDVLWHNDNGATSIWELDGSQVIGTALLGSLSPDWHIADTGDFNGDGKSDIVWRNDNGAATVWELDGGHIITAVSLGNVGTDWHLLA
jgi:hypothetical protein